MFCPKCRLKFADDKSICPTCRTRLVRLSLTEGSADTPRLPRLVVLRVFLDVHEAYVAQSVLQAHEIDARVWTDDGGGFHPTLRMGNGARLLVRADEAIAADEVLRDGDDFEEDDED